MNRLLAAVLLFAAVPTFSQNQVRFDQITVDDGLSQSAIKTMVQDKYGYLWIGTLDGLNKYDGNNFYVYHHQANNPNTIPRSDIHRVFIDNTQNLWVSTAGYLSRFNSEKDTFENYPFLTGGKPNTALHVFDLHQESDSVLVLSTSKGIWEFNMLKKKLSQNPAYAQFDQEEIHNYCITDGGMIWVASRNSVFVSRGVNKPFTNLFSSNRRTSFLHTNKTNEVYLQSFDSLYKFDFAANRFRSLHGFPKDKPADEQHMQMLKLSTGELWVMRKEVYVYDSLDSYSKTLRAINEDPFSLSGDYLSCVYETKDGVVWIGSNGMGLNKYSPKLSVFNYFGSFSGAPISLTSKFVTAIFTKDDNEIYVGTTSGLDVLDLKKIKTTHFEINTINGRKARVNKLVMSPTGELWIATSNGLQIFDGKKTHFTGVPQFDDPTTIVSDLIFISPTEVMIANSVGIFLLNTKTKHVTDLTNNGTLTMRIMNRALWAERFGQIIQYDTGTRPFLQLHNYKHIPNDNTSFPDATVKCFFQDSSGKIWIGTLGGGLVMYDEKNQTFRSFTEKDGLPNNVVYGILEDESNNLWLSTNKGIAVFSKSKLRCIRNYNKNHGLQGDEFNTNAYFKSPAGIMYFGGVDGLTAFDPKEALNIVSEIPKGIITGLFVNGARQEQIKDQQSLGQIIEDNEMKLAWSERNFGFEISSLGFSYPAHTSYQYILEGYENSWTLIENERRIQFTNIPPGRYVFRVKASNSFGEWEAEGVALAIQIKPPIWRTPWFIAMMIGMIVTIVYALFRWRTKALRRQTTLLEQLVSERTRALQIQQEEIAAQNEELTAQSEMMDHRNTELEKVKASLEQRVGERTTVLQKVNEELIDQNTKLEQFAFITAHNIRGPVARIQGLINLLHTGDQQVVNLLDASAKDLDEVISDLSKVLSIRKGVGNLSEHVELKSQLQFVIKTLTDEIKNVGATVDIDDFSEISIDGLRPYIYSIFYNLIHNALKYSSHERSVLIKCSNKISENHVIIEVEDNGIGIDMRYASDKIFNLYQRFHTEVAGKGFGLFLARTQVESMGGTISVQSTQGKFTRFTIEFPLNKEEVQTPKD